MDYRVRFFAIVVTAVIGIAVSNSGVLGKDSGICADPVADRRPVAAAGEGGFEWG